MILDAIIGLVVGIFTGILALLPSMEAPDFGNFGSSLGSGLGVASEFFPVGTLGLCIAAVVAAWLFTTAWGALVWLYNKIPFKFT